jgi:hypothetical protein
MVGILSSESRLGGHADGVSVFEPAYKAAQQGSNSRSASRLAVRTRGERQDYRLISRRGRPVGVDKLGKVVRSAVVFTGHRMRINVESRGNVRVSERTRDSNDIDTLRELQRSVGMPEVVKSYPAGYPGSL